MCGSLPMSLWRCWKTYYQTKTISYVGCLVQCYFFTALVHVKVCILAVMAFDRYMAICSPLLYGSKMSRTVCAHLISVTYICGFSVSLICTLWTYGLCFCGNFEINHFYCADRPLIKTACGGSTVKNAPWLLLLGWISHIPSQWFSCPIPSS